jgi:microcystin-dependent protein
MAEAFIAQLDTATPPGSAFVSNADEVMRTIKSAVKSSFPSVNGAVTLTHTQINALPGDIVSSQTALKNTVDPQGYTSISGPAAATVVPKGGIIMWAPAAGAIPSGWRLCDGGTYNGVTVPDLRSRFVMCEPTGFSGTRSVAESATVATGGSHSHTVTVSPHALTTAEMPAHDHRVRGSTSGATDNWAHLNQTASQGFAGIRGATSGLGFYSASGDGSDLMENTGGGDPHTHGNTVSTDAGHTHSVSGILPAHFILAFICYVGA